MVMRPRMHAIARRRRRAFSLVSPRITMAESIYCSNNVKTKGGGSIATARGRGGCTARTVGAQRKRCGTPPAIRPYHGAILSPSFDWDYAQFASMVATPRGGRAFSKSPETDQRHRPHAPSIAVLARNAADPFPGLRRGRGGAGAAAHPLGPRRLRAVL